MASGGTWTHLDLLEITREQSQPVIGAAGSELYGLRGHGEGGARTPGHGLHSGVVVDLLEDLASGVSEGAGGGTGAGAGKRQKQVL